MRCTNCSQVVKPIVAFDIDGTLGDYHGHFEKFAAQWLCHGRREAMPNYDGSGKYRDWFARAYFTDIETFRTIKLAYRQSGLKRSMPCDRDAQPVLQILRELGAETWLVTTRPYLKLDGIDPDTRFWLEFNRIPYDHLLYGPQKYERLVEQVDRERIVAVIDDDVNQFLEATNLDLRAFLLRTEYNRACSVSDTCSSLWNAGRTVEMYLNNWIVQHHNNAEGRVA